MLVTNVFGTPAGNNNILVDPGATLAFVGAGNLTLSGTVTNNGAIRFNEGGAMCGDANKIIVRSSVAGTQRAWSGGGVYSMRNVDVMDQAGTSAIWSVTARSTEAAPSRGAQYAVARRPKAPISPA